MSLARSCDEILQKLCKYVVSIQLVYIVYALQGKRPGFPLITPAFHRLSLAGGITVVLAPFPTRCRDQIVPLKASGKFPGHIGQSSLFFLS